MNEQAMPANRSMPAAAVIPVLAYADVRQAVDWLCRAFGFTERLRIGDHRAQLAVGGGCIVATGLAGMETPPSSGVSRVPTERRSDASHSVMVRVPDVDRHCEQAKQAGAAIITSPADYPYGERQYTAVDPGGHRWTFSQTIGDVDPQDWGGELLEGVRA